MNILKIDVANYIIW